MSATSASTLRPKIRSELEVGTSAFRRANLAIFFSGFASLAMLYGTQPVLPVLMEVFAIVPATASLLLSAGTAGLALVLIPASVLADRYGRERVMKLSLVTAAVLALAAALVTDFYQLLVLRALLGAATAGIPAPTIAYLSEEVAHNAQGRAIGLYLAGNAFGAMCGRFIAALVTEWATWRWGLAALGIIGVLAAMVLFRTLPAAQYFQPRPISPAPLLADVRRIIGDSGLRALFATGFLILGCFVGLYNYLGFRFNAAPYALGPIAISMVFLLYAVGSVSSAWTGRLTDRFGYRNVLWTMIMLMGGGLMVTMADALPIVIAGVALVTCGFFGANTVASSWVARRAGHLRTLAAALYMCSYYLGGSIIGSLTGFAWDFAGWPGVVAGLMLCLLIVLALVHGLRNMSRGIRVEPLDARSSIGI